MFDGNLKKLKSLEGRKAARKKIIYTTSRTICSIISFVLNRRDNTAQLENSLTFLACGQFLAVARLRSIDHSQSRLLKIQSLKASHQSIASSPSSSSSAQP
ncbi:hypothetical protein PCASD_01756 [Puccinia coronata f. sp. avenae]|uniref:Uncharacterized protein n=1 Tax=Puccinia coronata f. sp. avenae TaxID=200324 RepID=A0A2N5VJZ8_9BASI|nr:hypothetical protein PCASD_01756 [Puccinia coronata f. sp. avenae]